MNERNEISNATRDKIRIGLSAAKPAIENRDFRLQWQRADSAQNQAENENAEREPIAEMHDGP